jgi:hypothetical protein
MPLLLFRCSQSHLVKQPRLRARRGAVEIPASTAAVIGLLVGISLVVGAIGGYRVGVAVNQRPIPVDSSKATNATAVPDSTKQLATTCAGKPETLRWGCYREVLDQRLSQAGVEAASNMLRDLTHADPSVDRDVHMYAHGIGIDAFRMHPDIDATFSHCTPEFSSGCYHGVLQAYFDMKGTADPKVVEGACSPYELAPEKRWLLFQCLHGMGHGLNMALDHDLPKALVACDLLQERWHRESCYGGVFMENITHVTMPEHPATMLAAHDHSKPSGVASMTGMHMGNGTTPETFKAIDPKDPQYPCSIVADRYVQECYRIQTALMLYLNHQSLPKTAHDCDQAPSAARPWCYESLGRDISAISDYQTVAAVRMCTVGTLSLRKYCYAGTAESFVDNQAKADAGFGICNAVPTVGDKPTCYERVGELVLSLAATPQDREAMCSLPSPSATKSCREGAQLIPPSTKGKATG